MILETKRTYLREFLNSDIKELSRIYSDEDVMKHIGRGGPLNAAQTLKMINHWQSAYEEPGYGLWAVVNKDLITNRYHFHQEKLVPAPVLPEVQ
jgi:RimJ/RimL family protein N-acetyltransferase